MPFSTHLQSLNSIHDALASLQSPTLIQSLVCEATGHIAENCTIFNGCVTLDTPFMREFFASLDARDLENDEEAVFALFECLAIFFREKRLRMGGSKLAPQEEAVLNYFESSGNWPPDDHTMVNDWYWYKLPRKLVEESVQTLSTAPY